MKRAYKLDSATVCKLVPEGKPGTYFLGEKLDDRFYVLYVGRSDACLKTRLLQHANAGIFNFFRFRMSRSISGAYKKGITKDILVLELVEDLVKEGDFLTKKIAESIEKYQIEFQDEIPKRELVSKINSNELLIEFLGSHNIKKIQETYKNKKLQYKKHHE